MPIEALFQTPSATMSSTMFRKKKEVVTHKGWSNLYEDILISLLELIDSVEDFYAFAGVCRSWRSAVIKGNYLKYKVPVYLFPKKFRDPFSECCSVHEGEIHQVDLPETRGKMCYSPLGWLMNLYTGNPTLFNPLTRAQIQLPLLPPSYAFNSASVMKFALSSSPSLTSNYAVMVQAELALAYFKTGYNNGRWAIILNTTMKFCDTVHYKGQFYVVDEGGFVFVCDMEDPINARLRLVAPEIPKKLFGPITDHIKELYLVESPAGVLFLVVLQSASFKAFEVPLVNGKSWSRLKNLRRIILFLGAHSSSISIEAVEGEANRIYRADRVQHKNT